MEKKNKKIRCFISAPYGENLSPIIDVLKEYDIEIISPLDFKYQSVTLFEQIKKEIRKSDFIIAVIPNDYKNENIYFELGIAVGLGKKVVLFVPPNISIPLDIKSFLTVRSEIQNREAFRFILDQIKDISFKPTKIKKSIKKIGSPLGGKVNYYLDKIEYPKSKYKEYELVEIVRQILNDSGINVLSQSKELESYADLAIWADNLDSYLGNPILIEIKNKISNYDKIYFQIKNFIAKSNSRSAIIIHFDKAPAPKDFLLNKDPSIYFLNIFELLNELRDNSFEEIIIQRRNKRVHGDTL